MSTNIKDKIEALKLEIKTLYEKNVHLTAELDSLNALIAKMDNLIITLREAYDSATALNQQNYQNLLAKYVEEAQRARVEAEKWKNEYNNYLKAQL